MIENIENNGYLQMDDGMKLCYERFLVCMKKMFPEYKCPRVHRRGSKVDNTAVMSGSLRNGSNRSREHQPKKRSRRNARAFWHNFTGYGTRRRSLRSVPTATGTSDKTTDTNTAAFGGAYIEQQPGICVPGCCCL